MINLNNVWNRAGIGHGSLDLQLDMHLYSVVRHVTDCATGTVCILTWGAVLLYDSFTQFFFQTCNLFYSSFSSI